MVNCNSFIRTLIPNLIKMIVYFLGSFGVHVVMNLDDNYTHAFYGKLGFVENTHEAIKGKIVMGRTF